jgi:Prokaryotic Cytochrome C oxidase subunit IV
MNRLVPTRVTAVFASLVIATCVTWWLGSQHSHTGQGLRIAVVMTVSIAFAKIYFIGQDFMELRHAPRGLRAAFAVWVIVVGGAAAGLCVL